MGVFSVSIVIPTFNSSVTLADCLNSIAQQDYPKDQIEVIIADGGSTDGTKDLVALMKEKINLVSVDNVLKTGEAGKAAALKSAKNEIVAFIDSDNILPNKDWLKKMTAPFQLPEIIASEPLHFTYRRQDGFITRYCALLGMNDPLCLFLGNYDRFSLLTNRWTEVAVTQTAREGFVEVGFLSPRLPTIGANGFLVRRTALLACPIKDYFFDIDTLQHLYAKNPQLKVAKVEEGIIHIYSKRISSFVSKQIRRFMDFTYYKAQGIRSFRWDAVPRGKLVKFVLFTLFGVTILQAIKGYCRKQDKAWFFHPLACFITLSVYASLTLRNRFFALQPMRR